MRPQTPVIVRPEGSRNDRYSHFPARTQVVLPVLDCPGMRMRSKKVSVFSGRVQKNPRGFAFIIPDKAGIEDAYVSRAQARFLLQNDRVEYRLEERGKKRAAKILSLISPGTEKLVGKIVRSGNSLWFSTQEGDCCHIEKTNELKTLLDNQWALAQLLVHPFESGTGKVSLLQILGQSLLPSHDTLLILSKFGIESAFSHSALADAEEAVRGSNTLRTGRKDLQETSFVTVDGAGAMDFDDAIFVKEMDSSYALYVGIADVAAFVREGGALDQSALSRGTSVYFPGFCIPMLPEILSNDHCSLRQSVPRFAVVLEIHFDKSGETKRVSFYEAILKIKHRITYDELHHFYTQDEGLRRKFENVATSLEAALRLFHILSRKRSSRGVLDFELPESQMVIDETGFPRFIRAAKRFESHRLIEEFMIAANREVAKALRGSQTPTLYRVHEPPKNEAFEELNQTFRALGIPMKLSDNSPKAYSKILADTAKLPQADTINRLVLRAQKIACYEDNPKGHFGLALRDYTHFTSPIRRYPDLIVHRSLKRLIKSNQKSDTVSGEPSADLHRIGRDASALERRAMEAERYAIKRKFCWYMTHQLGETFPGRVTWITERGLSVLLPDFAMEGYLPLDRLNGFHQFDEKRLCLHKRPGHEVISIGSDIVVRVERVELDDNEVLLSESNFQKSRTSLKGLSLK